MHWFSSIVVGLFLLALAISFFEIVYSQRKVVVDVKETIG